MKQNIEQLAAEERRNYFKQWRRRNKGKVKMYNSNYWKRRAVKKSEEKGE